MRSNLKLVFFFFLFGCMSPQENMNYDQNPEVKRLSDLLNSGLNDDHFYKVDSITFYSKLESGLILVLPSSSCFNCFEDLNKYLHKYFLSHLDKELLIIRNNKIKEREIIYSMNDVLPLDRILIKDIKEFSKINQHDFFPKIAFFRSGKISGVEVFEQGNEEKMSDYFSFLDLINF